MLCQKEIWGKRLDFCIRQVMWSPTVFLMASRYKYTKEISYFAYFTNRKYRIVSEREPVVFLLQPFGVGFHLPSRQTAVPAGQPVSAVALAEEGRRPGLSGQVQRTGILAQGQRQQGRTGTLDSKPQKRKLFFFSPHLLHLRVNKVWSILILRCHCHDLIYL